MLLSRNVVKKLPSIYMNMRDFVMVVLLGILIVQYLLKVIISDWLLENMQIFFTYMFFLFPMCVFESEMELLINTY